MPLSAQGVGLRLHAHIALLAGLLMLAGSCSARRPARHRVIMHAVQFDPADLTVAVGDTIEWSNHDIVPHTSTAADGAWNSGNIAPDSSWSSVIRRAGEARYACSYHPNMKARIVAR